MLFAYCLTYQLIREIIATYLRKNPISSPIRLLSRTTVIVIGTARRFLRRLSNRPWTMWSASVLWRNSRCGGPVTAHTCCCKPAYRSWTTICGTPSADGFPAWIRRSKCHWRQQHKSPAPGLFHSLVFGWRVGKNSRLLLSLPQFCMLSQLPLAKEK